MTIGCGIIVLVTVVVTVLLELEDEESVVVDTVLGAEVDREFEIEIEVEMEEPVVIAVLVPVSDGVDWVWESVDATEFVPVFIFVGNADGMERVFVSVFEKEGTGSEMLRFKADVAIARKTARCDTDFIEITFT